jgi:hypothetical protein
MNIKTNLNIKPLTKKNSLVNYKRNSKFKGKKMKNGNLLIKPIVLSLLTFSVFSTNIQAGASNGSFTEISMFSETEYRNAICTDNYKETDYTFVEVRGGNKQYPTDLARGQFDKYSIYKPSNAERIVVSAITLQANHSYTYTYTTNNYNTVEEYLSSETPSLTQTHITAGITGNDNEWSYLYLGIPSNEIHEVMSLSTVKAAYTLTNTNCEKVRGGVEEALGNEDTPTTVIDAVNDLAAGEQEEQEEQPELVEEVGPHVYSAATGALMDENFKFHINQINIDTETSVITIGADFELATSLNGTPYRREGDAEDVYYFKLTNPYFTEKDQDADGFSVEDGDCNDNDETVNPDASEFLATENKNCVIELKTP